MAKPRRIGAITGSRGEWGYIRPILRLIGLGALHCHLYDPASIVTLLERAGLAPLHVDQIFEPSGKISVFAFAAVR
jgi:hypothetical protein